MAINWVQMKPWDNYQINVVKNSSFFFLRITKLKFLTHWKNKKYGLKDLLSSVEVNDPSI